MTRHRSASGTKLHPAPGSEYVNEPLYSKAEWVDEARREPPESAKSLHRIMRTWEISDKELADGFSVDQPTVRIWLLEGVPLGKRELAVRLATATDLLARHFRADAIPAIVHRPIPIAHHRSLIDQLRDADINGVLETVREMLRFEAANG